MKNQRRRRTAGPRADRLQARQPIIFTRNSPVGQSGMKTRLRDARVDDAPPVNFLRNSPAFETQLLSHFLAQLDLVPQLLAPFPELGGDFRALADRLSNFQATDQLHGG